MFRLARSSSLTRRRVTSVASRPIVNRRTLLHSRSLFTQTATNRRGLKILPKRSGRPGDGVGGGWYVPGMVFGGAAYFMWSEMNEFRTVTNPAKDANFEELTKLISSDSVPSQGPGIVLTQAPEEFQETDARDDLVAPVIDQVIEAEEHITEQPPRSVAKCDESATVEEVVSDDVSGENPIVESKSEELATVEESVDNEMSSDNTPSLETVDPVLSQDEYADEERPDIDLSDPIVIPDEVDQVDCDPHALPEFVPYLIIGGGAASFAAMRSITGTDPGTKVLILTDEEYAPYQRPPLSKEFWAGDTQLAAESLRFENWGGKKRSVFMDDEWHFAAAGELMHYDCTKVGLACNSKVSHIDTTTNTAILTDGRSVRYGKCLVAIGGKPRQLDELASIQGVTYYRYLNDFMKLEQQCREEFRGKQIVVIGGGFLGSELAVALGGKSEECGFTVRQIIKETGNLGFILPDYLSRWTKEKVDKCGVSVTTEAKVTGATQTEDGKISLELNTGETVECDHVVAAVGLEIDRDFAEKSGIDWDEKRGGMVVNSELQACKDVWIAGDATSFHDKKLGRRRVEHHDHAIVTGRLAGTNMASEDQSSYWHQSMYWSDLGPEVGFEAIGLTDCKTLKTLGVFNKATDADTPRARDVDADEKAGTGAESVTQSKDYGKGVVFYLNNIDKVVGVVSWNLFGKMKRARKVIADEIIIQDEDDLDELAKLFFPKKKVKAPVAPASVEPTVPADTEPIAEGITSPEVGNASLDVAPVDTVPSEGTTSEPIKNAEISTDISADTLPVDESVPLESAPVTPASVESVAPADTEPHIAEGITSAEVENASLDVAPVDTVPNEGTTTESIKSTQTSTDTLPVESNESVPLEAVTSSESSATSSVAVEASTVDAVIASEMVVAAGDVKLLGSIAEAVKEVQTSNDIAVSVESIPPVSTLPEDGTTAEPVKDVQTTTDTVPVESGEPAPFEASSPVSEATSSVAVQVPSSPTLVECDESISVSKPETPVEGSTISPKISPDPVQQTAADTATAHETIVAADDAKSLTKSTTVQTLPIEKVAVPKVQPAMPVPEDNPVDTHVPPIDTVATPLVASSENSSKPTTPSN